MFKNIIKKVRKVRVLRKMEKLDSILLFSGEYIPNKKKIEEAYEALKKELKEIG